MFSHISPRVCDWVLIKIILYVTPVLKEDPEHTHAAHCPVQGLNHYLPLWRKDELGAEHAARVLQVPSDEMLSLQSIIAGNVSSSFIAQTARRRFSDLENFQMLQSWLGESLVGMEVPRDGNCGVWSIMQLQNGGKLMNHDDASVKAEQVALRQEIASKWREASKSKMWQCIYVELCRVFEEPPVPPPDSPPSKSSQPSDPPPPSKSDPDAGGPGGGRKPKPELVTPSKRRPLPTFFLDLCTPPKTKNIEVVGAQPSALPEPEKAELPNVGGAVRYRLRGKRQELRSVVGGALDRDASPSTRMKEPKPDKSMPTDLNPENATQGDGEVEHVQTPKKKPKRRNRGCWKKVKSEEDRASEAVRVYFASKGLTYAFSQAFHSRRVATGGKCKEFALMQKELLHGDYKPQCDACTAMLRVKGFDLQACRDMIAEAVLESKNLSPATGKLCEYLDDLDGVNIGDGSSKQPLPICNGDPTVDNEEPPNPDPQEDAGEDHETDIDEILRKYRFLELLEADSFGKCQPVRCTVCRSARQPSGKVFECVSLKPKQFLNFVKQHCRAPGHIAAVARKVASEKGLAVGMEEEEADPLHDTDALVPCKGASLTHGGDKVSSFRDEILLWAQMTLLASKFSKHTYSLDIAKQEVTVHHESCERLTCKPVKDEVRPACKACSDARLKDVALRSAIRMKIKHFAASLLQSKLFHSEEKTLTLVSEIKKTQLYICASKRLDDIVAMDLVKLQNVVRSSWMKMPKDSCTPQCIKFIDTCVMPSIKVNVKDCPAEINQLANLFTAQLGSCDDFAKESLHHVTLKILKSTASGKLASNPAAMGIILQCLDVIDRKDRGIQTLKRPKNKTEVEEGLIQEAAHLLAANGCPSELMRHLGFSKTYTLRSLSAVDALLPSGLPCPPLAIMFNDVLKQNMAIIDSLIERRGDARRRMCLCWDFTYLLQMHCCMTLHQQRGLVGGPFSMKDPTSKSPTSFQKLLDGHTLEETTKANRMSLVH